MKDDLNPARGILNGFLISLVIWGAVCWSFGCASPVQCQVVQVPITWQDGTVRQMSLQMCRPVL